MAQLVLDWLNEDVGLSRRIDSLEEDFRDGYMLGELMAFFNQQEDFDKFLTKGNPDAKINNFCLLEVSMKRLGISFNSKIAFDIMNGNVGVIRTLLYEIKTAIDRIAKSTHPLVVKTKDGENAEKLVRVVHLTKPLYDKSMSKTFENCVRAFIPNPSDLLLEEANSRFKEKERQFYNTVAQKEETGLQDHLAEFQRRKNIEKQRKRQEKEFNDTWNKMNVEQWKKNQLRARDRKMLKEKVDLRMTTMRESAVMTMRVDARETMLKGIDEFEEKLRNEIFPTDPDLEATVGRAIRDFGGGEDTDVPSLRTLNQEFLDAGLSHAQKKLKEHHENLMETQKVHNRRRLRFFSGSENAHIHRLRLQTESEIVTQLLNLSHPEESSVESKRRINLSIPIIQENISSRQNLIAAYNKKLYKHLDELTAEKARREVNWIIAPRVAAQKDLVLISREAESSASRQAAVQVAQQTLDKLLDLVDRVCWTRSFASLHGQTLLAAQGQSSSGLPEEFWSDVKACFAADVPYPRSISYPRELNPSSDLPESITFKPLFADAEWVYKQPFSAADVLDPPTIDMLAERDKDSFVTKLSCVLSSDPQGGAPLQLTDAEAEFAFPPDWLLTCSPDHLLGQTVVAMRSVLQPVAEDPGPVLTTPQSFLRLCIFGFSDSARLALSTQLRKDFGIDEVVLEHLLLAAVTAAKSGETGGDIDDSLCSEVYETLARGETVSDELSVAVLVCRLQRLIASEGCKGFVLQDFPRTRRQAGLLVRAISGIDFEASKPHPSDLASAFALASPCELPPYDPLKCGLDAVLVLDTDIPAIINQRLSSREDLSSGNIVYVGEDCRDVSSLRELYQPLAARQTAGADLKFQADGYTELKAFLAKLSLLCEFSSSAFADDASLSAAVSQEVRSLFADKLALPESVNDQPGVSQEVDTVPGEATSEATSDAAVATEDANVAVQTAQFAPPIRLSIPIQLSSALNCIWSSCELVSSSIALDVFKGLRDVRYQMIQRFRCSSDAVNSLLIRRDEKQDVFDDFRTQFNSVEEDMRFDPDMILELHLRTQELRKTFENIANRRRTEAEGLVEKIRSDGSVLVLSHRSRCEMAALVQGELNRFTASCHVLLDSSKALAKFKNSVSFCNLIEEVLGDDASASVSKDLKAKAAPPAKGKGTEAVITPYRTATCPTVLQEVLMKTIPMATAAAAVTADPKAKDAKGKPAEASNAADPFSASEAGAMEYLNSWSEGTFSINRALYAFPEGSTDPVVEAVCSSVEKAVWSEAARHKRTIEAIKDSLQTQLDWLQSTESIVLSHLSTLVQSQWDRESAASERLEGMIWECIEASTPITRSWLLAADVVVVLSNQLIIEDPPAPPVPVVNNFFADRLNTEQNRFMKEAICNLAQGDSVLHEDIVALTRIASARSCYGLGNMRTALFPASSFACNREACADNLSISLPEGLMSIPAEAGAAESEFSSSLLLSDLIQRTTRTGFEEERVGMETSDVLRSKIEIGLRKTANTFML